MLRNPSDSTSQSQPDERVTSVPTASLSPVVKQSAAPEWVKIRFCSALIIGPGRNEHLLSFVVQVFFGRTVFPSLHKHIYDATHLLVQ